MWRKTRIGYDTACTIRALRRDIPNAGRAWGTQLARIADKLESGEYALVETTPSNLEEHRRAQYLDQPAWQDP